MVTQLRSGLPNPVGGVYWVYLDDPYFSPYVPIYAGVTETARGYQVYDPERFTEDSTRWAIDFVDNLAGLRFQEATEDVRAVRDPSEDRLFAKQARVEEEAARLHADSPPRPSGRWRGPTGRSPGARRRSTARLTPDRSSGLRCASSIVTGSSPSISASGSRRAASSVVRSSRVWYRRRAPPSRGVDRPRGKA
jgi:hypothetical protein